MEMRTFDHEGKRWWVVADDRGAVSIHAVHVPADFRQLVSVRDPQGDGRLFPDCITYHTPVEDGTDGSHADCPALGGRSCDPDAGKTAVYILGMWETLSYHDQYLADTLTELHAQEWPPAAASAQAGE